MTDDAIPAASPHTSVAAPAELPKLRSDSARYVADMLLQLRQIACTAGLEKVASSIDGAYYHAYAALGGQTGKNGNWKPHVPTERGSLPDPA